MVAHTVAHLSQSLPAPAANLTRAHGNIDVLNARGLRQLAGVDTARLVELMRATGEPAGVAALSQG
ncbi:hypothetical protein MUB01_15655 [Mycolicibacterium smegmatis]|uniref:Carbamoyl-phosphate synthase small chain n=2 Tax=Mycolicibacterium smegmatis TaxID=1772 RepID=A0R1E7_MYCS2|nr:carbamoyl-phosphate synthase small subunit [Mycolicibacterium smegmatis]ABK70434.1 carbamoyl-phosphate synthase small chain [Mycolicibacterium smegmatis MC2 155]AIU09780.1 hypothetical protein LJ00_23375 [Mycolicibacterium smegmatis MC2 155]AIU16405.1 hypothetical protein LI99_23380 [Mycolicibacterium smegmatis]AIU23028.1 hypothetical protein LI98_23385 [Mycolicibacterium smegmatis]MCC3339721.1 hypothetical protein [Mycolicibacterium smegmatis]